MALKAEMRRRVKDCERTTLWHGTKEKSVDGIVRFGFNRSYSGGNKRTAHGQGVYFATEASYSCHNQYAKKDSQGQRRLFLCKALVGKYVKGHKDMRVADHNVFDSAVDDVNNPGIFVIFKDVQAYPEYLIICKDK
ncbi:hypothetical protein V1264_024451 [Littorina saxatilis]|uniref:Poly [ADP-ribose] polymerase n=2 Tax=Littorina saxatilis TaxID=31220 RepID=A0AAN9AMU3_9CAEN